MNIPPTKSPSNSFPVRTSACPGLSRIVSALDGGICRIKLPCGQLTSRQADVIADVSTRYASGVIELTNRSNIQIRGVQAAHADALVTILIAAGLGPTTPGGDDVRNLMVSPTAGIDIDALIDVAPIAREILALLQTQTHLHALSPKFALLLDGGERLAMREHPHDVWLSYIDAEQPLFAVGFAGCPALNHALAAIPVQRAIEFIDAVLSAFLACASPAQHRMRDLLATMPANIFLDSVQRRLSFPLVAAMSHWRCVPSAQQNLRIGIQPQHQGGLNYVGAVPVLGRLHAKQLHALAEIAQESGDSSLRLTPWQSVLLPNIPKESSATVLENLKKLGLGVDADDALAHVIACTGSRGCAKGLADTKADALQLASSLRSQKAKQENSTITDVHLSGCLRACAAAHVAPMTLLAVATGRYDVFVRDNNISRTEEKSRFGRLIATAVTIDDVSKLLINPVFKLDITDA